MSEEDLHIFEETATADTNSKEGYELPYSPSPDDRLDTMLELADVRFGERAVDLGAGEGKLLVSFAKAGAIIDGFEIDEYRFQLAKRNIDHFRQRSRARVFRADFWAEDLSPYSLVLIYGISSIMPRLEEKLLRESYPGTRIVSNFFTFPRMLPLISENNVFLYRIPG